MADQLLTGTTLIEDKRTEKGNILSIPFNAFVVEDFDDDISYKDDGANSYLLLNGAALGPQCPVMLPHGATVTSVVVYANVSTESWHLYRTPVAGSDSGEQMATAALNTISTSITSPIVSNQDFRYHIVLDNMDATDRIYGAVIVYD